MNLSLETMACRDVVPADRGRMAIGALEYRLLVCNAGLAFVDLVDQRLFVRVILLLCVALLTRKYRHVGILHRSDVAVLRDAQIARRAVFFYMAGSLMLELSP